MKPSLHAGGGVYTAVWAVLLLLTLAAYLLAGHGPGGALAMGAVLAVTLLKGQLVAWYFMGLNRVRPAWRLAMLAYLLLVGAAIAGAYLIAPTGLH